MRSLSRTISKRLKVVLFLLAVILTAYAIVGIIPPPAPTKAQAPPAGGIPEFPVEWTVALVGALASLFLIRRRVR